MIDNKRLELVAPCGIDCGICELYLCRDNQELFDVLVSKGIPQEFVKHSLVNKKRYFSGKMEIGNGPQI